MKFELPPYPYDKLAPVLAEASLFPGGVIDLSIGTPSDPTPPVVSEALGSSRAENGYPPSVGSLELRAAAVDWMSRRLGLAGFDSGQVAACVGTKEFVASTPGLVSLLVPDRTRVFYPQVAYPTYDMGARLARLVPNSVPVNADGSLDVGSISDQHAKEGLCLWLNSPSNPTGAVCDDSNAIEWAREHGILVLADECYAEFCWDQPFVSALRHGSEGVIAVHSLSKRSNFAGIRVGFYAGDRTWVGRLSELRKHAGLMVPGPSQHAAAVALADDGHVEVQRERYLRRLEMLSAALDAAGLKASVPAGTFYLWVKTPCSEWEFVERLARDCGVVCSPGTFYGCRDGFVRLAVVAQDERIAEASRRIASVDLSK